VTSPEVEFRALTASEWFRRNREIAGFHNPTRALYQSVRELVENSLDATEPYGITPTIRVSVDYVDESKGWVSLYVEDNGIGIPRDEVPNVFGRVFYGSKYRVKQHRGVFGLGLKMVVLYAQTTTNTPVYVRSAPIGSRRIFEFQMTIDTSKNEPIVLHYRELPNRSYWHGLAVRVVLEGDWNRAKRRIEEYLRRTAIANPYAEFVLKGPDLELRIPRSTLKLPPPPKEGLPHPKGVDVELLKQLIAANGPTTLVKLLAENFDGVGERTARSFLEWAGFNPEASTSELTQEDLALLAVRMREYEGWRRPKGDWLSPLGELLEIGVRSMLKPEVVFTTTRKPSSYSGNPFIVEVALAWGGQIPASDRPMLYRFANKIPLIYDEGVDVARKVVDEIDWGLYKVKFPAPLAIVVHLCSTKIPYASAGKEAIAEIPEVEEELRCAVRDVARRLRAYLHKKEKEEELMLKYATFMRYLHEVASSLAYITNSASVEVVASKLRGLIERKLKVAKPHEEE